jgi:2-phospho-L-lactate guanylyltransferase
MARTLAILPVKRFELAKQRLSDELEPDFRRRLAAAMVGDVLDALIRCAAISVTLVISNERAVIALAEACGAETTGDPHEAGQSAAALIGINRAVAESFDRALLVPGDTPALDANELGELLDEPADGPRIVVVPDRHGTGTNALLLTPPDAIMPTFGPGSFRRHRERASAAELECAVRRPPSLLLDIDTPGDLAALRQRLERHDGLALRTRAVLAGGS